MFKREAIINLIYLLAPILLAVIIALLLPLRFNRQSLIENSPNTSTDSIASSNINERATEPAFKGMELYSWKNENDEWCFALMYGTNRDKSYDEITSKENTIVGIPNLKEKLKLLALGEQLFWFNSLRNPPADAKYKLAYPPEIVIKDIKNYCDDLNIKMHDGSINR
ncbi:MAG: hypothetical protein HY811_10865 [Planctomycetes bacterium]|nr:hypothetical protein [Planctomycetota bacterium]